MKIKNIKINSFGNLEDKEMELSDNINIIYGKNESGKSTLLKFISNTFYGTSRNKKGREYSDYEKYKPWVREDFSGKIKYELNNGEQFEVYREFSKKSPKIYNSNLEDISKEFEIDKNSGNQFFYEQTNVDEATFYSSVASMQQEVKLEKNSQSVLIQKMANIAGTGDDNVSFKKAMDKLYKKQLDEVGTYRSQGKPINIAQNKLKELENKKQELLEYTDIKFDLETNKNEIEESIKNDEVKIEILKQLKEINNNLTFENQKLNYNKSLVQKDDDEIENLKLQKNIIFQNNNIKSEEDLKQNYIVENDYKDNNKNDKNNENKVNLIKYIILFIIILIVNIALFAMFSNSILKFIGLIGIPIILIMYICEKNKIKELEIIRKNKEELNKKTEENKRLIIEAKNKKILDELNVINTKIDVIENNKKEQLQLIDETKNKIKELNDIEKQKIRNKYISKMDINEIDKLLNSEDVNYLLNNCVSNVNEKKLELHRIELNKNNILPQLENLAKIEEEIAITEEEYNGLINKNNAIIVAKQILEEAYEKMKNDITPKFTNNLSENIQIISGGKYNKVSINDENGLMVELASGEYVPAERLSLGTIDQLYLSLRLSINEEISNENMPIILDESFAYYDDERLENILKYLVQNYSNKQIIILTCTNREENILNNLNYNFNKVIL